MPTKAQMRLTLIVIGLVALARTPIKLAAARRSTDAGVSGLVGNAVNGLV